MPSGGAPPLFFKDLLNCVEKVAENLVMALAVMFVLVSC